VKTKRNETKTEPNGYKYNGGGVEASKNWRSTVSENRSDLKECAECGGWQETNASGKDVHVELQSRFTNAIFCFAFHG
jgi:hypothetical protein